MDFLKTLWPTPFKIKTKDVGSLIVQLIIFLLICTVVGWLIGILAGVAVIGVLFALIGSLLELYSIVGIVLCVLKFLGTVK